ncbi:MAG TPA: caspase family protein [Chthonomonadaceae bacterium]|nr:caspase family protein [Chthonomonadaceae bacterium]
MRTPSYRRTVLSLPALLLLCAAAARADRALVVGVNEYPNLVAAELEGSVNDAATIAEGLRANGFTVAEITNKQATRKGILKALDEMKRRCKPTEQFAFYFAGHGSVADEVGSVLLPYDASETVYLSADDLYTAIKAVPASNRTVLLDACFSGGMSRSFDPNKKWRTRFYPLRVRSGRRRPPARANSADTTQHLSGQSDVCYFTASKRTETAKEMVLDGKPHGVFSFYLAPMLLNKPPRWKQVEEKVNDNVAKETDDTQHPTLTPAFKDLPFLPKKEEVPTPPPPAPRTVWDDYLATNPRPDQLKLLLDPNTATFKKGSPDDADKGSNSRFTLRAQIGATGGYLVVMERGVSGAINLLFPAPAKKEDVESTRVSAGQEIRFPPDTTNARGERVQHVYYADAIGTERVNAILFKSKERAMALLRAFPANGKIETIQGARDLRVEDVETDNSPFYTSDVIFEIVAP